MSNSRLAIALAAVAFVAAPVLAQQTVPQEPQVLDHGPLHEAFADPLKFDSQEQLIVDRAPPEPVEELPPEIKPEGINVQWLPGYWMWDQTRNDFIWVSGVYREMPPGRTWVVGYWSETPEGYLWTPGFWAAAGGQTVNYLPDPPASLEEGPTSPAPGEAYFWVPGCWQYRTNRYVWQAGYWYEGRQNWVWVPNHYCYTPRGVVYVNGYWDYPLANRGLLYAPVHWGPSYYPARGYVYRPRAVIAATRLLTALFISPRYGYYYGPRYAYSNNNFYPWYSAYNGFYSGRRGYDPLLAYYAWNTGHNRRGWQDDLRRDWDRHWDDRGRRDHFDNSRRRGDNNLDYLGGLVQNVDRINHEDFQHNRLSRLGDQDINRIRQDADRYRQFAEHRAENEARGDSNRGPRGDHDQPGGNNGRGELARGLDIPDWARQQGNRGRGLATTDRQRDLAQSDHRDQRRMQGDGQEGPARQFRGYRGGLPDQSQLDNDRRNDDRRSQADQARRRAEQMRDAQQQSLDNARRQAEQRNQVDQARRRVEQMRDAQQRGQDEARRRSLPQAPGQAQPQGPTNQFRGFRGQTPRQAPSADPRRGASAGTLPRLSPGGQTPTRTLDRQTNSSRLSQPSPQPQIERRRGSQPNMSRGRSIQATPQSRQSSRAPAVAPSGRGNRTPSTSPGNGGNNRGSFTPGSNLRKARGGK